MTKFQIPMAVLILSLWVLIWSANWKVDISVHAGDTNTAGGNTAAWLWLLGSFAVSVTSLIAVVVSGVRSRPGPQFKTSRP